MVRERKSRGSKGSTNKVLIDAETEEREKELK